MNATVDKTNWFGTLSVTMHRATAGVLENCGETAGIDEALRVKATKLTRAPTAVQLQRAARQSPADLLALQGDEPAGERALWREGIAG